MAAGGLGHPVSGLRLEVRKLVKDMGSEMVEP